MPPPVRMSFSGTATNLEQQPTAPQRTQRTIGRTDGRQVEEMLSLIDPTTPRAYWDFMIDHQYGERWFQDSPIYREVSRDSRDSREEDV